MEHANAEGRSLHIRRLLPAGAASHLVRLIMGFEITVGGIVVPIWVSFPGVLAAALLALWMVVAARRA